MIKPASEPLSAYEVSGNHGTEFVVRPRHDIGIDTAGSLLDDLNAKIHKQKTPALTLDLSLVSYLDEFGCITLSELKESVQQRNGRFEIIHANRQVREKFEKFLAEQDAQCAVL
jgi:anti-anti-sigma regulatory factor